ncbi:MAG TPA: adenylate/guanylate cyclase domain-containing protein [Gaiellaceae bacterium]|nr:adenylate/guanylate cyclase domain-containing protein [Gaiellaceae bacterium]
MRPETRYARSGDVSIAYQVAGSGPFDLVYVPGFVSHVELRWSVPSFAEHLRQLVSFCRLILFDKRGTGMSDRVAGAPTLETRMDDLRAVMDAAAVRRAALFGVSEGAPMCLLFAASYPERTAALVLRSGYPRTLWAPDYPWGRTEERYRQDLERELRIYGSPAQAEAFVRSLASWEEEDVAAIVDYLRWSASPGALEALVTMNREIDVRNVLPAIRVPTLIVHGADDPVVELEAARYMAQRIPGALLVEVPGVGHLHFGRGTDTVHAEVERFLTELWEEGAWEESERDRILATVLFTDIVAASERASALGDRAWRELLARHHQLVRRQLARFRGRELDTAGDGFLASFDGPARAIRCARAIVESVRELGLEVRAGLHTGECELTEGKVAGIAVHTGARVAALAGSGEVLVSGTVKDLVAGSGLRFDDRGVHELKGIPGEWRLYAVVGDE